MLFRTPTDGSPGYGRFRDARERGTERFTPRGGARVIRPRMMLSADLVQLLDGGRDHDQIRTGSERGGKRFPREAVGGVDG
jgi:hypothetical protein